MVWVCTKLRDRFGFVGGSGGLAAVCGVTTATGALEGRVVIWFPMSVLFPRVRRGSHVCEPERSRAVFSPHVPGGKLALGAHGGPGPSEAGTGGR